MSNRGSPNLVNTFLYISELFIMSFPYDEEFFEFLSKS